MHKTIEGVYEDGKIILKEIPEFKKSKVMVTFVEETDGHKVFRIIPDIFKNPLKVSQIKKFSKEELHERYAG